MRRMPSATFRLAVSDAAMSVRSVSVSTASLGRRFMRLAFLAGNSVRMSVVIGVHLGFHVGPRPRNCNISPGAQTERRGGAGTEGGLNGGKDPSGRIFLTRERDRTQPLQLG